LLYSSRGKQQTFAIEIRSDNTARKQSVLENSGDFMEEVFWAGKWSDFSGKTDSIFKSMLVNVI
jgi:hypothetical protein